MSAMPSIIATLMLASISLVATHAQQPIQEVEVEKWVAEQNECGDDLDQIHIIKLDAVDFTHDGRPQVIVVAMSCNTGTAGPDVQSVLSRGSDGKLIELNVPVVDSKVLDETLFGPGSADLDAEGDLLELRYTDSTGRKNPLVVKYKWNGKGFEIARVEKSKPFATSYHCSKAKQNTDRAICNVKALANLDLRLSVLYKNLVAALPAPDKSALRAEQRKWLAVRDAACPANDKWFVDCLQNRYRERMAELQKALSATKADH